MSESGVPGPAGGEESVSDVVLWDGDNGTLREPSRRVLVQLLRGPYLSASRHGNLWTALLSDEDAVRSSLADLFLDLVTDHAAQVAFVRNTSADVDAPKVMRTATLTFLDTALLLHLRQTLLQESGGRKTIVGADEVADQLQVYRGKDNADIAGFSKRINSSWQKMVKYGLLAATSTEGRFEVSPVLRLVFGAEEIAAVQAEYRRLAAEVEPGSAELPDTDSAELPDTDEETE
ncbi:DUF4194 domain-containing protein [Arthrobacter pascens]|uniref:DUF4194 domain-containing protein n=1 Tax=Arthrobacter pascens TaxID=1677 RepID=UPI00196A78F9|nr:DUF4194 domain-containing protein [Arthrobacter pascens]MBN3498344.1 DUF4194 domain-containing protein [Arthrobacter pascens]